MSERAQEADQLVVKRMKIKGQAVRSVMMQKSVNVDGSQLEPTTSAPHNEDCKLLELSAELRNIIYEFVLLQKDDIVVTPTLRSPALLQVSRQIRTETLAMWYESNSFEIAVNDCKTDLSRAWDRTHHALGVKSPLSWTLRGSPTGAILPDGAGPYARTIALTYKRAPRILGSRIAASCTKMSESKESSWANCEDLLSNLRHVVAKLDSRWLLETDAVEAGNA
ncbi:hypothetical protein LTR17_006423 [Elasticomyces elasticus]|nr:hypothetical protein LTR17_006423 [Elasticomyces elasticus]